MTRKHYLDPSKLHLRDEVQLVITPSFRYFEAKRVIPHYVFHLSKAPLDVVVVFFAGYGEAEAIRITKRLRGYKVVFVAGYPFDQAPHRFVEFERLGLTPHLDLIIAKSSAMAPQIEQFLGREVHVISNGVNTDIFNPENTNIKGDLVRERFSIPGRSPILLTVAAIEERKGIQHVIAALGETRSQEGPAHYVIVGDGPYRASLERVAGANNVSERVHFAGSVDNVIPYYMAADLFLLLSHGEGLPNALLEAWSMKKAVVVSNAPPYPDIIPHTAGILIDPLNVPLVTGAINELLANANRRHSMGLQGRDHAIRSYSWEGVAGKYAKAFQLLSDKPRS